MLSKKARGFVYPAALILAFLAIYAGLMGALLGANRRLFFARGAARVYPLFYAGAFNALFALCCYCYLRALLVRPAAPPRFWGFFLEQPEDKQKRMCMTCNCFKPERTHHCSTCGQCVLVMDHHCPWLNNCVGFSNRKMFMLLISYAFALTLLIALGTPALLARQARQAAAQRRGYAALAAAAGAYVLGCAGLYTMWGFVSYHYRLVDANKTTIEEMDRKRGNNPGDYDFGRDFNWKFVCGTQPLLWPLPWDTGAAAPFGDGVVMRVNALNETGLRSRGNVDAEEGLSSSSLRDAPDWKNNSTEDPLNQFHRLRPAPPDRSRSPLMDDFY